MFGELDLQSGSAAEDAGSLDLVRTRGRSFAQHLQKPRYRGLDDQS